MSLGLESFPSDRWMIRRPNPEKIPQSRKKSKLYFTERPLIKFVWPQRNQFDSTWPLGCQTWYNRKDSHPASRIKHDTYGKSSLSINQFVALKFESRRTGLIDWLLVWFIAPSTSSLIRWEEGYLLTFRTENYSTGDYTDLARCLSFLIFNPSCRQEAQQGVVVFCTRSSADRSLFLLFGSFEKFLRGFQKAEIERGNVVAEEGLFAAVLSNILLNKSLSGVLRITETQFFLSGFGSCRSSSGFFTRHKWKSITHWRSDKCLNSDLQKDSLLATMQRISWEISFNIKEDLSGSVVIERTVRFICQMANEHPSSCSLLKVGSD